MEAYIAQWLNLLVRWMHFIFGAAWIGTSFYFNWLNNNIRKPETPRDGVDAGAACAAEQRGSHVAGQCANTVSVLGNDGVGSTRLARRLVQAKRRSKQETVPETQPLWVHRQGPLSSHVRSRLHAWMERPSSATAIAPTRRPNAGLR